MYVPKLAQICADNDLFFCVQIGFETENLTDASVKWEIWLGGSAGLRPYLKTQIGPDISGWVQNWFSLGLITHTIFNNYNPGHRITSARAQITARIFARRTSQMWLEVLTSMH